MEKKKTKESIVCLENDANLENPCVDTFKVKGKASCNICLKQFSRPSACREHIKNAHCGEYRFKCDKCNKKFQSEKGLHTHLESSHENESKDPFICSTCGHVFLYRRSLIRHCKAKQHAYPKSSSKTKQFKWGSKNGIECKICGVMISSYAIDIHMRYHHGDEETREYKCTECEYKTVRKDKLLRHEREVHLTFNMEVQAIKKSFETEKKSVYQCPHCKKILKTLEEVDNHVLGKICLLTCNVCEKTFTRKENLNRHLKKIHNME